MRLTDRDYVILKELFRWRFCLARHIKVLCGFMGQRATDRRLKILIETGYIDKKRYLYGIPSIYTITHKGKILLGVNKRIDKIRLEQIIHDIKVLDIACYYIVKHNICLNDILTEKELHSIDGFSNRKHKPDFVLKKDSKKYAIEIELNLKSIKRFENNVKDNFLNYEKQIWYIPKSEFKIRKILEEWQQAYNIEIYVLEETL